MRKHAIFALLLFATAQIRLAAQSTPLDPHTPSNWSNVGYHGTIPSAFDQIINVKTAFNLKGDGATDDATALQQAINNKFTNYGSQFVVFYFPEGNYKLGSSISIPASASRLVLIGQGSDKTKFTVTHSSKVFNVAASNQPGLTTIPFGNYPQYVRGSSSITVPFTGVQTGDFVEIEAEDGNWHGNYGPDNSDPVVQCRVGQIIKVTAASGSNLTLEDQLRLDYGINDGVDLHPKAQKITPVHDIGFQNFSVINAGSQTQDCYNFIFNYAVDCWMWGVYSEKPYKAHVSISRSSAIEIRGCYFYNALKFGGGGEGYGITINTHSTNCLIEDNIFKRLRHAMMVQAGANGNVFGYNFSDEQKGVTYNTIYINEWPIIVETEEYDDGDISFHGLYPYDNLFEGNIALFADGDRHWGANGPRNALYRNEVRRSPQISCMNFYDYPNGYKASSGGIRLIGPYVSGVYQPQDYYVYGNTTPEKSGCQANYFTTNEADFDNSNVVYEHVGSNNNTAGYSMYYTGKPEHFLTASYSWPPVGCKDPTSIAPPQNIPAKDRFYFQTVKTSPAGPFSIANTYRVTVENDINGVKTVGRVGAYETIGGTPQWTSQTSPYPFYLPQNTTQQIRTESNYLQYNNQDNRHRNWNDDNNFQNLQKNVTVNQPLTETAYFKAAKSLTLQTNVDGPVNVIFRGETKTPPYSDYGFQSPFATDIGVQLTTSDGLANCQFFGWSDGNLNPNRAISLTEATTLTANLKAHMYSNNPNATMGSGQRKVVKAIDGNGKYVMVYESMNRIWLTTSSDGNSWGNEIDISAGSDFAINKFPSLTVYENIVAVVWQSAVESNEMFTIHLRRYDLNDNQLLPIENAYVCYTGSPLGLIEAKPVIAGNSFGFGGQGDDIMIAFHVPGEGIYVHTLNSQYGYGWANPELVPGTNSSCHSPSISSVYWFGNYQYNLCWKNDADDKIYYSELQYDAQSDDIQFYNESPVSPSGWSDNQYPSIIYSPDDKATIVWQAYDDVAEGYSVVVRQKPGGGSWGNITSFSSGTGFQPHPVVGSYRYGTNPYTKRTEVAWSYNNSVYSSTHTGSAWSPPIVVAYGTNGGGDIAIIPYNHTEANPTSLLKVFRNSNNSINLHVPLVQQQKIDNTDEEKGVSYRLNKHALIYLDSIPELAEKGCKGMIAFEIAKLSKESGTEKKSVKAEHNQRSLRSGSLNVSTNSDIMKIAGAYYAKGLEIPENVNLNDFGNLITVTIRDANTHAVLKEVWNVPLSTLASRTGKTDGQYKEMAVSLNGLRNKDVYLDVSFTGNTEPIFVDDYYIVSNEEDELRKFFDNEAEKIPTEYALYQNYPNPFNPSTTISFSLVEPRSVTLVIYNSIGQAVKTVVDDYYPAGHHHVTVNASSLSSGTYFYRLTARQSVRGKAGDFIATKSFTLIK